MSLITVDSDGIQATSRYNILQYLTEQFKAIYGENSYIDIGTEDYAMLSLLADLFNDIGNVGISVSQALNLQTATGTQLDNLSTIFYNTITRTPATYSTVEVTITGVAGVTIVNGKVRDSLNGIWNLPSSVTIPSNGSTNVTATYSELGEYLIDANSISGTSSILTPVSGWVSADNASESTAGIDIETDMVYRAKLALKAQGNSKSVLNTLYNNITSNDYLNYCTIWENDTASTSQASGGTIQNIPDFTSVSLYSVPSHSIVVAIYGQFDNISDDDIGQLIYNYKGTGVGTYAPSGESTSESSIITNDFGTQQTVSFVKAETEVVPVNIVLTQISSQAPALSDELISSIQDAVTAQINDYSIAYHLYTTDFYVTVATAISNTVGANLYNISSINFGTGVTDIQMEYNQKSYSTDSNVSVTLG